VRPPLSNVARRRELSGPHAGRVALESTESSDCRAGAGVRKRITLDLFCLRLPQSIMCLASRADGAVEYPITQKALSLVPSVHPPNESKDRFRKGRVGRPPRRLENCGCFVGQGEKKLKSLVAEDDATSRKLLCTYLSRYGICDIAGGGVEAVNAVQSARQSHQAYDLICMDLRLPGMDGQEAIREIRKQEASAGVDRPARIIVTTIHVEMEDITTALLGRCNAYMVKPIDTARLKKELKALGLIQ